jgi:hypothetical protein
MAGASVAGAAVGVAEGPQAANIMLAASNTVSIANKRLVIFLTPPYLFDTLVRKNGLKRTRQTELSHQCVGHHLLP